MATNPQLLLLTGRGSLTGRDRAGPLTATGAGSLRYALGKDGRINLCLNPRLANNTTGWVNSTSTITRIADDPDLGTCLEIVTGATPATGARTANEPASRRIVNKTYFTFSFDVKHVSGDPTWNVYGLEYDAAGTIIRSGTVGASFVATTTKQRITRTMLVSGTGTHHVQFGIRRPDATASTARITNVVIEEGSFTAASYFDGDSDGAMWVNPQTGFAGTAHNSPSYSRAAFWVEEGNLNYLANPSAEVNVADGVAALPSGTTTITRDTTYAYAGSASFKTVTPNAAAAEGLRLISATLNVTGVRTYTGSVYVRGSGTLSIITRIIYSDVTTVDSATSSVTLTDQWQRIITGPVTSDGVKTISTVQVRITTPTQQAATFYVDAAQVEEKAYATSYTDGSLGTGYAWTGPVHNSGSTRAATTITVPTSNHLDTTQGSVALWFKPGRDQWWGNDGKFLDILTASGSPSHFVLFRSSTNTLFTFAVQNIGAIWAHGKSANDQDWLHLVGTWKVGETTKLYVNGVLVATAASATTAAFTASANLNVGSNSANGDDSSIIGPFAIFDRPLTQAEITKLYTRTRPWEWGMLSPSRNKGWISGRMRKIGGLAGRVPS